MNNETTKQWLHAEKAKIDQTLRMLEDTAQATQMGTRRYDWYLAQSSLLSRLIDKLSPQDDMGPEEYGDES